MPATRLDHTKIDNIAKRDLTLAGISLTALALMIGFYRDNLNEAGLMIPLLFLAMVTFFLGSQFGYDAEHIWEARLADAAQYVGVMLLLSSFSIFIFQNYVGGLLTLLIFVFGILVIGFYFVRLIIWVPYRKLTRKEGDVEQKES